MEESDREWKEYKEHKDRELRKMNIKWEDLINKWGTMVEDIIVPGIPMPLREDLALWLKISRPIDKKDFKIKGVNMM